MRVITLTGHHRYYVVIEGSLQAAEIFDGGFDDLTCQLKPNGKFFNRKLALVTH